MRISTITNWAYALTLVLTALSAAAFILSAQSSLRERQAVEHQLELDRLVEHLALGADQETEEARLYVMRGDERHLAAFYVNEDRERRLESTIEGVESHVTPAERELLETIRADAQALDAIERQAIATYRGGDAEAARAALFGDEHDRLHQQLLESVQAFETSVDSRTNSAVQQAKARSDRFGLLARVMLALTALLFLAVLYFVLKRRVAVPLIRMTGIVQRLANQDYAVEVPVGLRRDEIGEMSEAIEIFRANGLERERLDAERRRDQRTKDLILQMMHRMQACQNQFELADVVARFMPQVFPEMPGRLFIYDSGRSALSSAADWLDPELPATSFAADDCWALRRGSPHLSNHAGEDVVCPHLSEGGREALCVPMMALGETVGLLSFEMPEQGGASFEASRLYLELIAENIALAVANLQFRDRLVGLARRDGLTGLLNRRSLDETIRSHLDLPAEMLVCMMLDVDHFKRFNDHFGHDAGDAVMQYLARILLEIIGGRGDVFRYGGEEFCILLPDVAEREGLDLAERIRIAVERSPLAHHGRLLDPITVSIGVASSPEQGPVASLVERADANLLKAKQAGRNRTEPAAG